MANLISLDEAKAFMSITGSDSNMDDVIENLINAISTSFENQMNRTILSAEYTEYKDGKGLSVLFPDQPDITSISGIWDLSGAAWGAYDDDNLIASTYYKVVDNYVIFRDMTLSNYIQNVKIIYTAGFAEVPEDLKLVTKQEVNRSYQSKDRLGVTTQEMAGESLTYDIGSFLSFTRTVLGKYTRVVVC